jgi:hypothetical protein
MNLTELIANAELNIGVAEGSGLGAVLLALVAIAFLIGRKPSSESLVRLFKTMRGGR